MIIKLLIEAGNMKPSPAISQKLGPLGINMGKVIAEVNKTTSQYKGLKVPVELDINAATKEFSVKALTPPASELVKKELGLDKASMMPKSIYAGNISIEQVINIAKTKAEQINANSLKAAVKVVLGTCLSSGILVESKNAKEIIEEVDKGQYDELISRAESEDLKPSSEKIERLKKDFEKVAASQEKLVKELQKAKEEAKTAATASATKATGEEKK